MKLARVVSGGGPASCAVIEGDAAFVLGAEDPTAVDMIAVLALLADDRPVVDAMAERALAGPPLPLSELRFLPPVLPPTVRDFVAFEEHVEGVARSVSGATGESVVVPEWYAAPAFYFSNPYAVLGAHDDVEVPPGCHVLDFELEVAAVIGREGRDLTPEQGHVAIVGYTILNDWSARDLQRVEMRVSLGPAKGKDSATTLGPWITTAEELDGYLDDERFLALPMTVDVNGVEIGRDLLSNMGWPFGELVAHAARGTWVRPGDVLGSGTCGNGGCLGELWGRRGRQDPPPLQPGDVVTMTVGGLGRISNRVVAGHEVVAVPPARTRPRNRP